MDNTYGTHQNPDVNFGSSFSLCFADHKIMKKNRLEETLGGLQSNPLPKGGYTVKSDQITL